MRHYLSCKMYRQLYCFIMAWNMVLTSALWNIAHSVLNLCQALANSSVHSLADFLVIG
jgi:hypothetical protein